MFLGLAPGVLLGVLLGVFLGVFLGRLLGVLQGVLLEELLRRDAATTTTVSPTGTAAWRWHGLLFAAFPTAANYAKITASSKAAAVVKQLAAGGGAGRCPDLSFSDRVSRGFGGRGNGHLVHRWLWRRRHRCHRRRGRPCRGWPFWPCHTRWPAQGPERSLVADREDRRWPHNDCIHKRRSDRGH